MNDELGWETLDRETAYTCPGFDVIHEAVRLPDGTITDFDYLSEPPAVVVLPFTPDEELVVVEEWRQAVDRVSRGLPAGSVEPSDDGLGEAASRELEEETGYEAGELEHLISVEPANGLLDSVHHHFVARDCTPTGERDHDDDESIRVDTTSLPALKTAIAAGDVRDGRTVVGVLYYDAFESV